MSARQRRGRDRQARQGIRRAEARGRRGGGAGRRPRRTGRCARSWPSPAISNMAAMAREELGELDARLPDLERDVALLLAPKDKDENASAILEVRAGTGGDEAALFAGDLFRMYQRYAAAARLAGGGGGRLRGRDGRLQGNHRLGHRRRGVRPAEVRERRAPGAARARHRGPGPHPHLRRHRRRAARARGRGHRDQRRRPAHRHLSLLRRRRPAREQDQLRRAHHPPAHRHRGDLVGKVAAPEPAPRP